MLRKKEETALANNGNDPQTKGTKNTFYVDIYGAYGKCNPPLRGKKDVEKMWEYINDGTIDLIGSDHAPFTLQEKLIIPLVKLVTPML